MIAWNQIPDIIEKTLRHHDAVVPTTLDDIMVADATARRRAREALQV
jgi:1-deoxy-D-xylulose 5-phosphate reductoisomerase